MDRKRKTGAAQGAIVVAGADDAFREWLVEKGERYSIIESTTCATKLAPLFVRACGRPTTMRYKGEARCARCINNLIK